MENWRKTYETHAVHSVVDGLRSEIPTENIDKSDCAEAVKRLEKNITRLQYALSSLDPDLVEENVLSNMGATHFNNVKQHLANFRSRHQASELHRAASMVAQAATSLHPYIPPAETVEDVEKIVKEVDSRFGRIVERMDQLLQDRADETEKSQKSNAASRKSLADARDEMAKAMEDEKGRISELSKKAEKDFAEDRARQHSDFQELMGDFSQTQATAVGDLIERFRTSMQSAHEEADRARQEILTLRNLAASESVGGEYKLQADGENNSFRTWRKISIGSWVAAVGWAIFAVLSNPQVSDVQPSEWLSIARSWVPSFLLIAVASYAGNQSSQHRQEELRLRKFALEMSAFEPFISDLHPDEKRDLRRKFSERAFANAQTNEINGTQTESEFPTILKPIIDLIKAVKK